MEGNVAKIIEGVRVDGSYDGPSTRQLINHALECDGDARAKEKAREILKHKLHEAGLGNTIY
jgi:hypothetical protein